MILFPLRDETFESFWKDTEGALYLSIMGREKEHNISELELSCLYLSHKMTDKLKLLSRHFSFTKISLQSCTATPPLLDYFLQHIQETYGQLHCFESNGTLSECWSESSVKILQEIPLQTLRLLGMRFPSSNADSSSSSIINGRAAASSSNSFANDTDINANTDRMEINETTNHPKHKQQQETPASYPKPLHQQLRELDLTGCQWEHLDSQLPFLQACTALQKISFKCCRLDDDDLYQILSVLPSLPNLTTIDLGVNQCGPRGLLAVRRLLESSSSSAVEYLDLSYQVVSGGIAFHMELLAQALLANARCKDEDDNVPKQPSLHHPLRVLRLAGNQIKDSQLVALAKALECQHCRLERLDLSANCLTDRGLAILSASLAHNHHLKSINLRNNEFATLQNFSIERNVSLHNVQHSCPPHCPATRWVNYICKLNQGGRLLLRNDNIPQGLWPKVLERCCQQSNNDAMYYLLQQGQHR